MHQPIYWDPRKEESEERNKRIDSELNPDNNYIPKYAQKGMFINSSSVLGKKRHGSVSQMFFKNTVLSVLIALLAALIYFIYFK